MQAQKSLHDLKQEHNLLCIVKIDDDIAYIRDALFGSGFESGLFYNQYSPSYLKYDLDLCSQNVASLKSKITKRLGYKLNWE